MIKATDPQLYFTKNDPQDRRVGELASPLDDDSVLRPHSFVVFGSADDEGIALNGGRIGAAAAPQRIRHFLYRMTADINLRTQHIYDGGDLVAQNRPLKQRHDLSFERSKKAYSLGCRVLHLGGGHDYGYPDASAFLQAAKDSGRPLVVINLDAHLDVRPTTQGLTSGTPFFRLLSDTDLPQFTFFEIYLQQHCNSTEHAEWAAQRGAQLHWVKKDQTQHENLESAISLFESQLVFHNNPLVFLSVCIDAFQSQIAPGCSQSWPTGIDCQSYFCLFDWLKQRCEISGLGIYEVAPPLDEIDSKTSKLAALIGYEFFRNA